GLTERRNPPHETEMRGTASGDDITVRTTRTIATIDLAMATTTGRGDETILTTRMTDVAIVITTITIGGTGRDHHHDPEAPYRPPLLPLPADHRADPHPRPPMEDGVHPPPDPAHATDHGHSPGHHTDDHHHRLSDRDKAGITHRRGE